MFKHRLPIFAQINRRVLPGHDGEGAAAGGEGGTGTGEQAVTMDAVKALVSQTVNTTVNNAISGLKKNDLPKLLETHIGPITTTLASITSTLQGLSGGSGGGSGSGGSGGGSGSGSGGNGQGIPPEVNATLKNLQETVKNQGTVIDSLKKDKEEAERRVETSERHGAIRTALSKLPLPFVSEEAAATAFNIVEPHVKRGDDGTLFAGDNLPVDAFIKDFIPEKHGYLLQSDKTSGSGARSGRATGERRGAQVSTDSIRPGMSPEERAAVLQQISAVVPQ